MKSSSIVTESAYWWNELSWYLMSEEINVYIYVYGWKEYAYYDVHKYLEKGYNNVQIQN